MYTCTKCGKTGETGPWYGGKTIESEDILCDKCGPEDRSTLVAEQDPGGQQPAAKPEPEVASVEPAQPAEDPVAEAVGEGSTEHGVTMEEPLPEPGPADETQP